MLSVQPFAGVKRAKRLAKKLLRRTNRFYANRFHSFDITMLRRAMNNLGVAAGDTIFVHSAYDRFQGFKGKPTDVLNLLEQLIGPGGTMLMPSFPFTGTAIDYVRSGMVTDIAQTPSRMGLLTEIFRRQKGTLRSIHPTHPVLARGAHGETMVNGHENARTPCGTGSPFAKLLDADANILFLGTSIESMTFFHYLEEKFEERLAVSPLTVEIFKTEVRVSGTAVPITMRLFDPALSRRRNIPKLLPELLRLEKLHREKIGNLSVMSVRAAAVRDAFEASLNRRVSFYDK